VGVPHVVIIGGGFGGLYAARRFRRQSVNVTSCRIEDHSVTRLGVNRISEVISDQCAFFYFSEIFFTAI